MWVVLQTARGGRPDRPDLAHPPGAPGPADPPDPADPPHPLVPADVAGRRSRPGGLRLAVGAAAVAVTAPYLVLKLAWLLGSTVGQADPAFFANTTYRLANLVTVGFDAVAALVAVALTWPWGRRLPAWLVLLPAWVAAGFLAPIAVLLPLSVATSSATPAPDDALRRWVYLLVYGGFGAQAVLLGAAFVLYARDRWGHVLAARNQDAVPGPTHAVQAVLTVLAVPLAAAVGASHLAWALGVRAGLPAAGLADLPTAHRLADGVYAAFAFAAAAGLPMLVHRRPRRGRLWVPLALSSVGAGSLVAWGGYQLALSAAKPELGSPVLGLVTPGKLLAGVLIAVVVLFLLAERFDAAGP